MISREEICSILEDREMVAYMRVLGFDVNKTDADRLFTLLDRDCTGELEVDEFVDGAVKLKGEAQSIDVFEISMECKKLDRLLHELLDSQSILTDLVSRTRLPCKASPAQMKLAIETIDGSQELQEPTQSTRISEESPGTQTSHESPKTQDASNFDREASVPPSANNASKACVSRSVSKASKQIPEPIHDDHNIKISVSKAKPETEDCSNGPRRIPVEVDQQI